MMNKREGKKELIKIQAEAYYRALKRIEQEKSNEEVKESHKSKWWENVFLLINVWFWPWKINRRFRIKENIADGLLVMVVSGIMKMGGLFLYLFGLISLLGIIVNIYNKQFEDIFTYIMFSTISLTIGGIIVISSKDIDSEKNGDRIYAYTSSFMSILAAILAVICIAITLK